MSYFRDNIERMSGYQPGYQPGEGQYIKLNTNENPYPPSPDVLEAVQEAANEDLRKYPDPLADDFREAASEVLDVQPENILCGNGSDELLNLAVRSFCAEGDLLVHPYPTYSLFKVLAEIQDAHTHVVEFPEDYSLPEGLIQPEAKLTLVANPNSPSGTMLSVQTLRSVANSIDGILLIDEAYADFADWNCLPLVKDCDNVIVTRTLSKSYSLAGVRFGFCIAQEDLIEGMMKLKDSYNVNRLSAAAATAAIKDQDWMQENTRKIRENRDFLAQELQSLGFQCWPSQANFVLARVPDGLDAKQIHRRLFRRGILVRYFDERRLDDCVRVTVGTRDEIESLLRELEAIIAEETAEPSGAE